MFTKKVLNIRNDARRQFANEIQSLLASGEYTREDFGSALIAAQDYFGLFSDESPASAFFGVPEAWIEEWMALAGCEVEYDGPSRQMVFYYLTAIMNLAEERSQPRVKLNNAPLSGNPCDSNIHRDKPWMKPIRSWLWSSSFNPNLSLPKQQGYKTLSPRAKHAVQILPDPVAHYTSGQSWQEFVKGAGGVGPKTIEELYSWLCKLGWEPKYYE